MAGWKKPAGTYLALRPRLQATLDSLEEHFPEANWVQAKGGFFVGLWLPDKTKRMSFIIEPRRKA